MNLNQSIGFYYLNIIPNYVHSFNYYMIIQLSFFSNKIIGLFYFLTKHFNSLFKVLIDLITIDYLTFKKRFLNVYHILSTTYTMRFFCKTYVNKYCKITSLTSIYVNINWYERESWDLFGIYYILHTDLRRILTDYGFKGFPLRKDFPLSGFIELKYDDSKKTITYTKIKLVQEFRTFTVMTPWKYFI